MASYRKKYTKSKIGRIKPKKSIFTRLWFWIIVLSLIIVAFAFYFFMFYSGVQVKNIVIHGNQKVASEDIENLILENINNKILSVGSWKIDSKSIFLINSEKLDNQILTNFPVIKDVKIDKKYMQTLVVDINERIPDAIFCPSLDRAIENEKGKCYFMDENGIIFEPLYVMPQNMIIVLQKINDSQVFTGERVVQQNIMNLLSKVEKNLKDNFQIDLKEALITSPLRLNVNTGENWQIYFDLDPNSDINSQLAKLNLLLSGELSSDNRKNLRYIDLRPKDRAIVCDNKTCGE